MTLEKKTDALTLYFPSPTLIRPHLGITSYCAFVVKSAKLRSGSVRSEFRSRSISVLDFSYLESPEFIGVQGPGPFKGQEEKACSSENSCNAGIAHIQYVSRARPKHPPEFRPGPCPGRTPGRSGSCLLALGDSRLARGGSGPWASRQHGCSYSFHAPYYSPYGLDPSVSHGHGPGLHDQRSPVPSNGTL